MGYKAYGSGAKHNAEYWANYDIVRTDEDDPYIVSASQNHKYNDWDKILKVDGNKVIAAKHNPLPSYDIVGKLNGNKLEVGEDLAKEIDALEEGDPILKVTDEYVRATENLPEYDEDDRIIIIRSDEVPPNKCLALGLGALFSGIFFDAVEDHKVLRL